MKTDALVQFPLLSLLGSLLACTPFNPEKMAALATVNNDPGALYALDDIFKKDKDVALAAIKKDAHSLLYVHDTLKRDKEVVLAAVSRVGILLVDIGANNPLYGDPEVILAAVKDNYPGAVSLASGALKADPEFVMQAMTLDVFSLCFAADQLQRDKKLIKFFLNKSPDRGCSNG